MGKLENEALVTNAPPELGDQLEGFASICSLIQTRLKIRESRGSDCGRFTKSW